MKNSVNLDISYNKGIKTLTPGMRMLMNERGWTMVHIPDESQHLSKVLEYHKDLNNIPTDKTDVIVGKDLFNDRDKVTLTNQSPLESNEKKALTNALNNKEKLITQDEFLEAVKLCGSNNKRVIMTKDGYVNVFVAHLKFLNLRQELILFIITLSQQFFCLHVTMMNTTQSS